MNVSYKLFIIIFVCFITVFISLGDVKSQDIDLDYSNYRMGYNPESDDVDRLVEKVPETSSRSILPKRYDLSRYVPPIGSQGRQGSCVGWASTYYALSMIEKKRRKWQYNNQNKNDYTRCSRGASRVFSPAWTYNQINGGRDKGSNRYNALTLLTYKGAAPCSVMPYNVKDYRTQPNSYQRRIANQYKIKGFKRIGVNNLTGIKEALYKGNPVISGFRITKDFYRLKASNNYTWDAMTTRVSGGHAMTIVGYNDYHRSSRGHRGAFKLVNSWGTRFGKRGFLWISYKVFPMVCKSNYVVYGRSGGGKNPVYINPNKPKKTKEVQAPVWVKATRGTYSNRVVVTWAKAQGAVTYAVMRKSASSNYGYSRLGYANRTIYYDYRARKGQSYNYKIISMGSRKKSSLNDSPIADGYIMKSSGTKPEKVFGLKGYASTGRYTRGVNLRWTTVSGAKNYQITRYDYSYRKWRIIGSINYGSYSDRAVYNGKKYSYAVRAMNRNGYGKWSDVIHINVSGGTSGSLPGRVTGVSASQGEYGGQILVKWRHVSGANYYKIWRYNTSSRRWDKVFTSRITYFYDRTSVAASRQRLFYAVKAVNNRGTSRSFSVYARGFSGYSWRGLGKAMTAPLKLRVKFNSANKRVFLRWNKSLGAKRYHIYRKNSLSGAFKKIAVVRRNAYRGKMPVKGELYFYTVRAVGKYGQESGNARPVATFKKIKYAIPRTLFVAGKGIKNFTGQWFGQHWKGGSNSTFMKLIITARKDRFKIEIDYGSSKKAKVNGNYAAMSRFLQAHGIEFELLKNFDNDVAKVTFNRGIISSEKIVTYFSREK